MSGPPRRIPDMPIKQIANNLLRVLPDNGRAVRRFYRRIVDARRHQEAPGQEILKPVRLVGVRSEADHCRIS